MTPTRIPYHGRTHRPGGSDPIGLLEARVPWVLFKGNLNGVTITHDVDSYVELSGLLASPVNNSGTVDADVFGAIDTSDIETEVMTAGSSNEPFNGIILRSPGLYLIEAGHGWYTDWGPVRINITVTHSDSEFSVIEHRLTLNSPSQSYFGDAPPTRLAGSTASDAIQWQVNLQKFLSVDDRAEDVVVKVYVVNADDSDHTFNNTDRTGGLDLAIYQLSSDGDSNP